MYKFALILVFLILASCARQRAAMDPMTFAPATPSTAWGPLKNSTLISSKYCETLLPKSFEEKTELSLAELIDIALQNSPATKITWAEARASAAQYGQSLSNYFPELSFSGTYTREMQSFFAVNTVVPYFLSQFTPAVTLNYTIFDFGQRRSSSDSARQALFYADWTHNQEIQTVIQAVMTNYYDYVYQKELLISYEANLDNATGTLEAANAQLKSGVNDLGDVSQARSKYLQTKINYISQKRNVENSHATLMQTIGLPANIQCKIQDLPEKIAIEPIIEKLDDLICQAQAQRQDLFAAQAQVKSQEAKVANAKAASKPVLTTQLELGKYWFGSQFGWEKYDWTVEFNLSFPIFQGFYYRNGVRNAKANLDQAAATLLQTELSIIKDVTTAHQNTLTASQTLQYSEEYVKTAQQEYDIALQDYNAGVNTILDVLSAQSSLADARAKLAGSKKDWFSSLASLAYATGSLCPAPPAEPLNIRL